MHCVIYKTISNFHDNFFTISVTQDLEERARQMKMRMNQYRSSGTGGSSGGSSHTSDTETIYGSSRSLRDPMALRDPYAVDTPTHSGPSRNSGRGTDRGQRTRRKGRVGEFAIFRAHLE